MLRETGSDPDVEFGLLLACSKQPTDEALVRDLASQVQDWQRLLRYAEFHEMTPLICHNLMDSGCSLSSTTFEHLATKARQNTQKNLLLTAELLRIMRALQAANIRAVPYKGPVLAAAAYGTLAARGFCDLDILVAETDVRRTLGIVSDLGYRAEYSLSPAQESKYFRNTCEYNFLHESKHTQVEIHWQIVPAKLGLKFEFNRLWSRVRFLPIGSSQLPILSPEDTLLVLSVHGFKHLWTSLKWVCDIAAVISSPEELDWTYVVSESARIGATRIVLIALSLANRMCQSPLPDPIRLRLSRDPVASAIAGEIVRSYSPGGSMSRMKSRLLMLRAYSGLRRRATYLARTLLDPATEEAVRTPERSIGVMRAQRVFHVTRQAISDVVNRRTS